MTQMPPGNYPPQGPIPYAGMYAPPPRTSGAAITSLILGILLCIPAITGLCAVLFGVIGIRATRDPSVRGRGMAIAGLTLGLVGLLGWSLMGGMLTLGYFQTAQDRTIVTAFVHDLDAGNISTAQAKCNSSITTAELQQVIAYMKGLGTLSSYSNNSYNIQWHGDGTATAVITGTATYSSGAHHVEATLLHSGKGAPVIQGYHIQ